MCYVMNIKRIIACLLPLGCCMLTACSGPPRFVAHGARDSAAEAAPPSRSGAAITSTSETKRWAKVYKDLLGVRYAYGGSSRKGFDCSGLVQYAYQGFDGRHLPRTVRALFDLGRSVSDKNLMAGDLVFYNTGGGRPSHVGIYLNNRQFLHASTSEGVELSSMDESYYATRYAGARRLAP
jgi:cell wall-associated NlpC family hydrolase